MESETIHESHVGLQLIFLFHMELLHVYSSSSTSSTTKTDQLQKVEPGFNLLEECWFFGNLLTNSKPKMSRSNSDPFPSTITTNQQDNLLISSNVKFLSSSTKKGNNFVPPKLVRAPSLPTSFMLAKNVEAIPENGGGHDYSGEIIMSKAQVPLPQHTLLRTPSLPLPPCIGSQKDDEDEEDQESEFKMGRLIRQASLNSSQTLPPRQTKSCMPRRPIKKILVVGNKEMLQEYQINLTKKGKMQSDLQKKEVERFKALNSKFEKQALEDDDSSNKVPSNLQQKSWGAKDEKVERRHHQSCDASSWHLKGSTTETIPEWSGKNEKRLPQDMKAQIKFWARAVASNARAPGVS